MLLGISAMLSTERYPAFEAFAFEVVTPSGEKGKYSVCYRKVLERLQED
jgi:hypothetical protein